MDLLQSSELPPIVDYILITLRAPKTGVFKNNCRELPVAIMLRFYQ